jgi:zinc-binding alcohol dehydrogenase family protein
MRAIGYHTPSPVLHEHSFEEFSLELPALRPTDLLIRVAAASVNPVDYKIRQQHSTAGGIPRVLGFDGAGTVEQLGSACLDPSVTGFAPGDRVFWCGELNRQGSNAQFQAVDFRTVAKIPAGVSFEDAAALPLTALTAHGALFDRLRIPIQQKNSPPHPENILIIGGAGGVGSIAIQLLRALTSINVYATANRPESAEWARAMGAHQVITSADLLEPTRRAQLPPFEYIFSTTHSDQYHTVFPALMPVGGRLTLIDDPEHFDIRSYKERSLTVSWMWVFDKTFHNTAQATQGAALTQIAHLLQAGKVRSTATKKISGLSVASLYQAHAHQESGSSIGKVVVGYEGG